MSNTMYNVKNRSAGVVVYTVPELHIRREFMPGQTFKVSADELEKLNFVPGGAYLIANYLQIQDVKMLEKLDVNAEPEYNMSEKDVADLILKGSIDEFMDALDFAPAGVIDLIKTLAVSLPMNDASKRIALKDKTGFDVEAAVRHQNEDIEEERGEKPVEGPKKRRVKKTENKSEELPAGRRTAPKKYDVVE